MPSITDLAYTKTYDDLTILTEAQLDSSFTSIQTYINDSLKDNLVQLALDAYGSTYTFTSNGSQSVTNTLFDKQSSATKYNSGDISIATVVDAAYTAVDAINAAISFTPEKTGKYRATFCFTHVAQLTAITEGQCEVSFRITDGTTASGTVRSGMYIPATAANNGRLVNPITISFIFTFTDTNSKTITLQKFNRIATNLNSNAVSATDATGELYMSVEKL